METVKIFDTTLRDGEQSPGISLDVAEKLEIAEQLARLGVDVIEAGFPIASDGDFDSVEAIAKAVRGPIIAGLSRTGFKDVDRAWEAVRHAERPRIHVFIATSKIHMEKKLRMTEEQVKAEVAARGRPGQGLLRRRRVLARRRLPLRPRLHVRGVPDRGRQRRDHAEHPRHRRLRACPRTTGSSSRYVIDNVRGDFVVSTHCHDDLGLAVANSLAGVAHGARQVECAINGLGERAGNAALEEVVMAIRTRGDYFDGVEGRRAAPRSSPARRGSSRGSPATTCSSTRRSSAATRSRTRPASTSTACSPTARPTR